MAAKPRPAIPYNGYGQRGVFRVSVKQSPPGLSHCFILSLEPRPCDSLPFLERLHGSAEIVGQATTFEAEGILVAAPLGYPARVQIMV